VEAVGGGLTTSIMLLSNTLATDNTVVRVGLSIDTANGLVQIARALAAFELIAGARSTKLDLLAGHHA